jgi:hypothetical protein
LFDHLNRQSLHKTTTAIQADATSSAEAAENQSRAGAERTESWSQTRFPRTLPVMNRIIIGVLGVPLILVLSTGCFGTGQTGAHDSMPALIAKQAIELDTGISASKIVITDIDAVDYRDSSLGCPQPDMTYLQVITPGYRVKALGKGRQFDVRIAGERAIVCDPNRSSSREIRVVPPTPETVRPTSSNNAAPAGNETVKCSSGGPWSSSDCEEEATK